MFYVRLICSEGHCDAIFEVRGALEELEGLVCETCQCGLQVIGWPEPVEDGEPRAGSAPEPLELVGVH